MNFAWGFILGLVVGGVLALALFADPLCRRAISTKTNSLGDKLGLSPDNPLRALADKAIWN